MSVSVFLSVVTAFLSVVTVFPSVVTVLLSVVTVSMGRDGLSTSVVSVYVCVPLPSEEGSSVSSVSVPSTIFLTAVIFFYRL